MNLHLKQFYLILKLVVLYILLYLLTGVIYLIWEPSYLKVISDPHVLIMFSIFFFYGVFIWTASYFYHHKIVKDDYL
jgi:hypothetical protein